MREWTVRRRFEQSPARSPVATPPARGLVQIWLSNVANVSQVRFNVASCKMHTRYVYKSFCRPGTRSIPIGITSLRFGTVVETPTGARGRRDGPAIKRTDFAFKRTNERGGERGRERRAISVGTVISPDSRSNAIKYISQYRLFIA